VGEEGVANRKTGAVILVPRRSISGGVGKIGGFRRIGFRKSSREEG